MIRSPKTFLKNVLFLLGLNHNNLNLEVVGNCIEIAFAFIHFHYPLKIIA